MPLPGPSPAAPGWTLGGVPASLPPVPLRESTSRNGTGFAFHPVYGRPSLRGKPKASRQCRTSPRADPPTTEAGTCQGPDTGSQEGSHRHRLRGHHGPLSPSRVSSLLLGLMLAARTTGSSVAVSCRFHVGEGTAAHSPADPTPGWQPQENWPCSGVVLRSGRYMSPKAPA